MRAAKERAMDSGNVIRHDFNHTKHSRTSENASHLLDLPGEIREVIYKALFKYAELIIDIPERLRPDHHKASSHPKRRKLPALLLVSKQIRREALPSYSSCVTVVYRCPMLSIPPYPNIPQHYLTNTRTVCFWTWQCHRPSIKYLRCQYPWLCRIIIKDFAPGSNDARRTFAAFSKFATNKDIAREVFAAAKGKAYTEEFVKRMPKYVRLYLEVEFVKDHVYERAILDIRKQTLVWKTINPP